MADLKITITYKEERAMVGIGSAEADPLWFQMEGDLEEVVARIPGLVVLARERWQAMAKYPTYNRPTPPPAPPRTTPQPRAGASKTKTVQEPKLFQ